MAITWHLHLTAVCLERRGSLHILNNETCLIWVISMAWTFLASTAILQRFHFHNTVFCMLISNCDLYFILFFTFLGYWHRAMLARGFMIENVEWNSVADLFLEPCYFRVPWVWAKFCLAGLEYWGSYIMFQSICEPSCVISPWLEVTSPSPTLRLLVWHHLTPSTLYSSSGFDSTRWKATWKQEICHTVTLSNSTFYGTL